MNFDKLLDNFLFARQIMAISPYRTGRLTTTKAWEDNSFSMHSDKSFGFSLSLVLSYFV